VFGAAFNRFSKPVAEQPFRGEGRCVSGRSSSAQIAFQGEFTERPRHAVVKTLYSRAHRIGLDGVSCLLDGLRKNISLGFSLFVVCLCVGRPALEVVILEKKQLQGFGDHVGRRSLDELRIELQLSLYDSSTRAWTVTVFGCFGGAFRMDNAFSFLFHTK